MEDANPTAIINLNWRLNTLTSLEIHDEVFANRKLQLTNIKSLVTIRIITITPNDLTLTRHHRIIVKHICPPFKDKALSRNLELEVPAHVCRRLIHNSWRGNEFRLHTIKLRHQSNRIINNPRVRSKLKGNVLHRRLQFTSNLFTTFHKSLNAENSLLTRLFTLHCSPGITFRRNKLTFDREVLNFTCGERHRHPMFSIKRREILNCSFNHLIFSPRG